jgi:hypothetical protein
MIETQRFASPQAAATEDFSPGHCRVVAVAEDGDEAYVLLDADPSGAGYLYGQNVHRRAGGWQTGSSGNGPGWMQSDAEHDAGTLALWGNAPPGADRVRAEWNDETREGEVQAGVYLLTWWRVPAPATFPRTAAFRVRGEWMPARV